MSIVWQYLDKKSAAIKVLKDYSSMKYIIENTGEEIKNIHDDMESVGSPSFDGMPKIHNPKASEERLIKGIVAIDVLRERYRQAVEYMNWFRPAWEELSEDEKYVLTEFYINDDSTQTSAVYNICDYFSIERSSAYNKKNRALEHLTVLLYGRV